MCTKRIHCVQLPELNGWETALVKYYLLFIYENLSPNYNYNFLNACMCGYTQARLSHTQIT